MVDAFSHFVVTVPVKSNNAKTAVKSHLYHWIIKFGPLNYLVIDRGSEYFNTDMAQLRTPLGIRDMGTKILVHLCVCSYKVHQKVGLINSTCTTMHKILNLSLQ